MSSRRQERQQRQRAGARVQPKRWFAESSETDGSSVSSSSEEVEELWRPVKRSKGFVPGNPLGPDEDLNMRLQRDLFFSSASSASDSDPSAMDLDTSMRYFQSNTSDPIHPMIVSEDSFSIDSLDLEKIQEEFETENGYETLNSFLEIAMPVLRGKNWARKRNIYNQINELLEFTLEFNQPSFTEEVAMKLNSLAADNLMTWLDVAVDQRKPLMIDILQQNDHWFQYFGSFVRSRFINNVLYSGIQSDEALFEYCVSKGPLFLTLVSILVAYIVNIRNGIIPFPKTFNIWFRKYFFLLDLIHRELQTQYPFLNDPHLFLCQQETGHHLIWNDRIHQLSIVDKGIPLESSVNQPSFYLIMDVNESNSQVNLFFFLDENIDRYESGDFAVNSAEEWFLTHDSHSTSGEFIQNLSFPEEDFKILNMFTEISQESE